MRSGAVTKPGSAAMLCVTCVVMTGIEEDPSAAEDQKGCRQKNRPETPTVRPRTCAHVARAACCVLRAACCVLRECELARFAENADRVYVRANTLLRVRVLQEEENVRKECGPSGQHHHEHRKPD